jgi:hypothetical protein
MNLWYRYYSTLVSCSLAALLVGCGGTDVESPASASNVDFLKTSDSAVTSDRDPETQTSTAASVTDDDGESEDSSELPGLPVGAKAPEFVLKDQQGNDRRFSEILAKGPVALVFYRSADW